MPAIDQSKAVTQAAISPLAVMRLLPEPPRAANAYKISCHRNSVSLESCIHIIPVSESTVKVSQRCLQAVAVFILILFVPFYLLAQGQIIEHKEEGYNFMLLPNGSAGWAYGPDGKQVGTIIRQNKVLRVVPSIHGCEADQLLAAFEAFRTHSRTKFQGTCVNGKQVAISAPPAGGESNAAPSSGIVIGGLTYRTIKSPEVAASLDLGITEIFDLNLLQANPGLLEDAKTLRYFVAMNNCIVELPGKPAYSATENNQMKRVMVNELDYPIVAAYYETHAAEILSDVPKTIRLNMGSSSLLDYDTARNAFPIGARQGRNPQRGIVLPRTPGIDAAQSTYSSMVGLCYEAKTLRGELTYAGILPAQYVMDIGEAHAFSEVPMDLATAHKYIDAVGQDRTVTVDATFILPNRPVPQRANCDETAPQKARCAMFTTKLQNVVVSKLHSGLPSIGSPLSRGAQADAMWPKQRPVSSADASKLLDPPIAILYDGGLGGKVTAATGPETDASVPSIPKPSQTGQGRSTSSAPGDAVSSADLVAHTGMMGANFDKHLSKCNAGDAGACDLTGFDLEHGFGVDKNLQAAKDYFKKSCDMGRKIACSRIR